MFSIDKQYVRHCGGEKWSSHARLGNVSCRTADKSCIASKHTNQYIFLTENK